MAVSQETRCTEPYLVKIHRVGGRERDGSPTYIGPWTFKTRMVREVVEGWLLGRVLNACAGKTKLSHNGEIVRNDLNPERDADYHVDVCEATKHFDAHSFDTVVFDPPFDQAQADEHYESMHARQLAPARKELSHLVRPGGVFLELGWNMHSPSSFDGWTREQLHIYNRGPTLQPVFLTVDRRKTRQANLNEAGYCE